MKASKKEGVEEGMASIAPPLAAPPPDRKTGQSMVTTAMTGGTYLDPDLQAPPVTIALTTSASALTAARGSMSGSPRRCRRREVSEWRLAIPDPAQAPN